MENEIQPPPPALESQDSVVTTASSDGNSISTNSTPLPDKERNGSASPPPRLASLTGLLMNQKSQRWNSTSSDSTATTKATPLSDGDQPPPSLARSVRFEEETGELRRTGSFSSLRRTAASHAAGSSNADKTPANLTEADLRRFVFHHSRAKRLVSGLRVHAFTRQAFVSSFTVGLAIGSVVAIVLKIIKDVTCRMLYS